MIDFLSDDGLSATCPAMILGFLWYNITLGIPTPHFLDEEGQSLHTIQDNMAVNNNLYVVVHTAYDYVSIEWFQNEFVSSFTLGDISNCVYIIKVEAIHAPLGARAYPWILSEYFLSVRPSVHPCVRPSMRACVRASVPLQISVECVYFV